MSIKGDFLFTERS